MDEIIKEFLIESHEGLDAMDQGLIALERNPHDKETLGSIFRSIHTIKGNSGFLGFHNLEGVAHVAEDLLCKMRDGVVVINPPLAGALLATVDAIRFMLGQIEATGHSGEKDFSALIALFASLESGDEQTGTFSEAAISRSPSASASCPTEPAAVEDKPAPQLEPREQVEHGLNKPVPSALEEPAPVPAENNTTRGPAVSEGTIRVNVELLDKLMNLVGELVLARNQVLQISDQGVDSTFLATSQRLNLITTELQSSVMKTRMQPIDNVWSKLPRMVRDLAASCGKEVRLEVVGKETELDKTIIEAIKDPLTHIIRNSIDHGIETPEIRKARNKPVEGSLKMRAYHEGGRVNIEIVDDGGGIDGEKVKLKSMQKGLISQEQASRMSDQEALHLIFLPGFSTAEKVTNVSGRGVGMDVVKTNIEKIGGTVDLQSRVGQGTTLKIKIPLTLAIIPALIVTSGGDRFAIPQVSLLELVRLEGNQPGQQVEQVNDAPVYRLRGNLLPLVYLDRELKLGSAALCPSTPVNIVVLQADGHPFGLVVDEINDTEEIVVKPLAKQLKGISSLAGATIMGDGRVALILDVFGLAREAGVLAELRDRSLFEKAPKAKVLDSRQTLLLFEGAKGSRLAIPLSTVSRLEEFPSSDVEYSGTQKVVRYRGQILPLIRVSDHVPSMFTESAESDPMQVVVYSEKNRSVGLVVGRIDDIVRESISAKRHAYGNCLFGSAVIQEKVTDLLDVQAVIRAADPNFYPEPAPLKAA